MVFSRSQPISTDEHQEIPNVYPISKESEPREDILDYYTKGSRTIY